MTEAALPEHLKLDRLPPEGATISGFMPLSALPRLSALLVSDAGSVEANLHLSAVDGGRFVIGGAVTATVEVRCQRCLEPVALALRARVTAVVVRAEEEVEQLGRHDEPVIAPRGELDVRAALEDELLLALPIVPRHETDCQPRHRHFRPPGEEAPAKENPFSALSRLKQDRGGNDE